MINALRVMSFCRPSWEKDAAQRRHALEQALGLSLFTRSQAGLEPTAGALGLVTHAEAMEGAAQALERVASGEAVEERGAVRLTASEMIGTEVLPASLTAFRRLHPRIVVELAISNRTQDLLRREADIAVRTVRPTQSALVTRKLGVLELGLHAHPSYLKQHGTPHTLEALREHALIGFDRAPSVQRLPRLGIPLRRELFAFRCDSDVGQYAALRAGFGIGACQVALARRDGLLPVLPQALRFQLGVWAVMHRDLRSSRRVRLLFDHVSEALLAHLERQR